MYKLASATRHDRVVYDLMGPWYIEGTNWPDLHCEPRASLPSAVQARATGLRLCACVVCGSARAGSLLQSSYSMHVAAAGDLNVQLTYWPLFTANKIEMVGSLTSLLQAQQENLISNVPLEMRSDSAAAPSGASALTSQVSTCIVNVVAF